MTLQLSIDREKATNEAVSFFGRLFPINQSIAIKTILGVWGAYFLVVSMRALYVDLGVAESVFVQRVLMTSVCLVFTWILYRLLILVRGGSISLSILAILLPAMILANLAAILDQIIFNHSAALFDFSYLLMPVKFGTLDWAYTLDEAFTRFFIFASWGALYLALAHNADVMHVLQRSRELERLHQESELRALRFQLNPHFVFNALNSVSSLIVDEKNKQAEQLVDGLADYMRAVLNDNGGQMISVDEEIAQQVRYLEIEQVRFPERLTFDVHIVEEVRNWKIPALIVQPLIENAIKYGVARSTKPVRIIVSAEKKAGKLELLVGNDGRISFGKDKDRGTGTGLANIRERLSAIYGASAALMTGNSDEGLAIARIVIPEESQRLVKA